ncbi:kinase-like protein [Zopfia rhizophila CBS 207.26]|uniref:Kinase-like protein n=1 Tax=Zopfia rhizophila CBS 207.26 TaxID=1314779 RepID=A0A6A6DHA4_9PEZI|nr:kinase-like protein [Zopfia rhizophila CBS 207.26]
MSSNLFAGSAGRDESRSFDQNRGRASHLVATDIDKPARLTIGKDQDLELEKKDLLRLPYRFLKNLGHGGSGRVEMVQDINTGLIFARKILRNYHSRKLEAIKQSFHNEVQVMRRLAEHHHVVRVFATYITHREFALILQPVADDGDLATFLQDIRDSATFEEMSIQKQEILEQAFGCLASGLAFMHKQEVRHKDIKPQNILIHQGSVLYADFGISFDYSEDGRSTTTGSLQALTRRYCAPEVANVGSRNRGSDVFSLACVFIEISATLWPDEFPDHLLDGPFCERIGDLLNALSNIRYPNNDNRIFIKQAIEAMLKFDSHERPTAAGVVAMLWSHWLVDYFCPSCISSRTSEVFQPFQINTQINGNADLGDGQNDHSDLLHQEREPHPLPSTSSTIAASNLLPITRGISLNVPESSNYESQHLDRPSESSHASQNNSSRPTVSSRD